MTVDKLLLEIETLREVLKPFAALADKTGNGKDEACWCGQDGAVIRYRDLRAARAILSGTSKPQDCGGLTKPQDQQTSTGVTGIAVPEPTIFEWLSIESAPMDGSSILLFSDMWIGTWGAIQMGSFRDGEWHTGEGSIAIDETDGGYGKEGDEDYEEPVSIAPTHWMRLPAPPSD